MKTFAKKYSTYMVLFILTFFNIAYAQSAAANLGDVSSNLTNSFGGMAEVMSSLSLLLGFGFALAAIIKYKSHRDNPMQVPLGSPIFLTIIALALLFLPFILKAAGYSVFGEDASSSAVTSLTMN